MGFGAVREVHGSSVHGANSRRHRVRQGRAGVAMGGTSAKGRLRVATTGSDFGWGRLEAGQSQIHQDAALGRDCCMVVTLAAVPSVGKPLRLGVCGWSLKQGAQRLAVPLQFAQTGNTATALACTLRGGQNQGPEYQGLQRSFTSERPGG